MELTSTEAEKLCPGDILLVNGSGLFSRGIDLVAGVEFSHVALYLGEGAGLVVEAAIGGVRLVPLRVVLGSSDALVVRRHSGLSVEAMAQIRLRALELVGQKYDIIQALGIGLWRLLRRLGLSWDKLVHNFEDQMICTELVAVLLAEGGFFFSDQPNPRLLTTEVILNCRQLDTVIVGCTNGKTHDNKNCPGPNS